MKNLYCIILLLASIPVLAQKPITPSPLALAPETGKYSTSGIVYVDSASGELLMEATYKWLSEVKYANSMASKGIITDEAFMRKITVNQYFISSPLTYNSKVRFTLHLEFKDGRFKYLFTDFYYLGAKKYDFEDAETNDDKLLVGKYILESNGYIREFLTGLKDYLQNYAPDESW